MKSLHKIVFGLLAVLALILVGCPSPVTGFDGDDSRYETSATIDVARMVFVEEDGTVIPLTTGSDDDPTNIVDFAVLDDGGSAARNAEGRERVRCIIIGRRGDGRTGVWALYRYRGLTFLPNEDGDQSSELMGLVEVDGHPWVGEGWEYEARAISDDGKVIIGQLRRPDGWEFFGDDVPAPEIGVWWTILETDAYYIISRARPMIMMHEPAPQDSIARCASSPGDRIRYWLRKLFEWFAVSVLDNAWNYMTDAEAFVPEEYIEGGIADGYYVVSGPDKNAVDSWAWFTAGSMEDIIVAPDVPTDPPVSPGPYPVAGPATMTFYQYYSFAIRIPLELSTGVPGTDYSDVVSYGALNLPAFLYLDGNEVVADRRAVPSSSDGSDYSQVVEFYTIDAEGDESEPFPITIIFSVYDPPS